MTILLSLLFIVVLFMLSYFFSASEAALTSLSKYKVKKFAVLKNPRNKTFQKWLQHPQELLVTILIGNNAVNISASVVATFVTLRIFARFPKEIVEFATWISVVFLILILAEILPKIYSKSNPERMALTIIGPLTAINRIIYPLIYPFLWISNKILKIQQVAPISKTTSLTVDEIKNIFIDSSSGGALEQETTRMLEGVLKLSKVRAREIMVPIEKVDAVNIENSNDVIIESLVNTSRSRVPVYSNNINNITGMIFLKDMIDKAHLEETEFSRDIIRPVYFVNQDEYINILLQEFKKGMAHCAVVVDNKNNVKGFITLEDILEEIVGEIMDEYEFVQKELGKI